MAVVVLAVAVAVGQDFSIFKVRRAIALQYALVDSLGSSALLPCMLPNVQYVVCQHCAISGCLNTHKYCAACALVLL
jgi:hypothetical protein